MEQAQLDGARDTEAIARIEMMAATIAAGMGKDIAECAAQEGGDRLLEVIGKAAAAIAVAIHKAVQRTSLYSTSAFTSRKETPEMRVERLAGHAHEVRRG